MRVQPILVNCYHSNTISVFINAFNNFINALVCIRFGSFDVVRMFYSQRCCCLCQMFEIHKESQFSWYQCFRLNNTYVCMLLFFILNNSLVFSQQLGNYAYETNTKNTCRNLDPCMIFSVRKILQYMFKIRPKLVKVVLVCWRSFVSSAGG